ncbi:MAG: hypothetical protein KGL35_28800 [Bradyrhizobium sp.]|nr:hypothetical protein [Bradyrhizobium sp.]
MRTKIVKVIRPIVEMPDHPGEWRAHDEWLEHDDWFKPSQWVKDCVGARSYVYFRAVWSADGWLFKAPIREHDYFW